MPYTVTRFEDTPNPNAMKCVLDASPTDRPRSYFNAKAATDAGDDLAVQLFAVPGVTNVLIHVGWISVCKAPDTRWPMVKAAIEKVLARAE